MQIRWSAALALLIAWAGSFAVARPADAQASVQVRVQVEPGACPDAALLREKLRPLLSTHAVLSFAASESAAESGTQATVSDLGPRYAIEVRGARREVEDERRNCLDRARVAAVFIALNPEAPAVAAPATPGGAPSTSSSTDTDASTTTQTASEAKDAAEKKAAADQQEDEESADEDEDESESDDDSDAFDPRSSALSIGMQVFGAAEHATEIAQSAFGAGTAVWLSRAGFRVALHVAALSPIDIELEPRANVSGRVALMRVPLTLTGSYLARIGRLEIGPTLGVALELFHLRGEGLARPQTELRVNPGAFAAGDAHLWLSSDLGLMLRFGVRAFPRAYRLSVEPTGRLGDTPRVWLAADLGLEWRFQ